MPGSLVARDISKSYAAVQVLDRVSLTIGPGDRVGIVGPNGIGKSTLLRVLAGLDAPDRGTVTCSGVVGYLPQEPAPQRGETVLGPTWHAAPGWTRPSGRWTRSRADSEQSPTSRVPMRTPSIASCSSAVPTSTRVPPRRSQTSVSRAALPARSTLCPAARRRGLRSPRFCSPGSTSFCSTNRRTTSTSSASSASSASSTSCRPALPSSRTTARSSTAPSRECSNWRRRPGRCTNTPARGPTTRPHGPATGRATRLRTRTTPTSATGTRACSHDARAKRAPVGRWLTGAGQTRCGERSRRQSSIWSGSTWSRSRGRRGSCS